MERTQIPVAGMVSSSSKEVSKLSSHSQRIQIVFREPCEDSDESISITATTIDECGSPRQLLMQRERLPVNERV